MTGYSVSSRGAIPGFLTDDLWLKVIEELELSPQQARIVCLILHGKQDKQIAAELQLSRDTIRTYLRRIFERLGVDSRVGLVLSVFAFCVGQLEKLAVSCHQSV